MAIKEKLSGGSQSTRGDGAASGSSESGNHSGALLDARLPSLPEMQAPEDKANAECVFPRRGEIDSDRMFRQRASRKDPSVSLSSRQSSEQEVGSGTGDEGIERTGLRLGLPIDTSASTPSSIISQPSIPFTRLGWEALPPYDEVVEGIQTLTTSYFQLGFLPKALFFESLKKDRDSISIFLIFSILSVSARFTPCLVRRYHGGRNATQAFLDRATCLVQEQMFTPSLESIQAFFLMSIAEWGNGDKHRSLVYMGIAVRLAGILRLHREETHKLPGTATREEIVHSEVARRTFWMLETFENLHSGSDSPIAFSYSDITVLLPCHEHDFTFGIQPAGRAALAGTHPAARNPMLTCLPNRSLFAVLLQTHNFWGKVARLVSADAASAGARAESRINASDYAKLSQDLVEFEASVPPQYCWSVWNLRGFKVEGLDLAYLSAVMVLGLSNIILRRSYLQDILSNRNYESPAERPDITEAWPTVADQLFNNMLKLHEQITAFFEYRSADQGYPALIVFCVYVCGSLANHLRLQPQVCPRFAPQAMQILQVSIKGLSELQSAWPLARRWYVALCKASERASLEEDPGEPVTRTHSPLVGDVEIVPGLDVQFNDPFPTDSMFEVFETYLWSDMSNMDEAGLLDIRTWRNT
ncbi:hypothetical protein S40293_01163 [Stachybotrys chartarum IBT 40293]|nr:hypothetical protein S40293_01163 [Stachybotrys chartarum IBT 40293]